MKLQQTPDTLYMTYDPRFRRGIGYGLMVVGGASLLAGVLALLASSSDGAEGLEWNLLLSGALAAVLFGFVGNLVRESAAQQATFVFDRQADTVTYTRSRGARTLETVAHPLSDVEDMEATQQVIPGGKSNKQYNLVLHLSGERIQPFLVRDALGKRESCKASETVRQFLGLDEAAESP